MHRSSCLASASSFLYVCIAASAGWTTPLLPSALFGDNAVLQREAAVPIWGTATAGEKVVVRFHEASASAVPTPTAIGA